MLRSRHKGIGRNSLHCKPNASGATLQRDLLPETSQNDVEILRRALGDFADGRIVRYLNYRGSLHKPTAVTGP
jgi:hypothetical protein